MSKPLQKLQCFRGWKLSFWFLQNYLCALNYTQVEVFWGHRPNLWTYAELEKCAASYSIFLSCLKTTLWKFMKQYFSAVIYETGKQCQSKKHFHQKIIHCLDNTRRNPKKRNIKTEHSSRTKLAHFLKKIKSIRCYQTFCSFLHRGIISQSCNILN